MDTISLDSIECAYDSNNFKECLKLCAKLLESENVNITANLTKVAIFTRTDSEYYSIEAAKRIIAFLLKIYPESQKLRFWEAQLEYYDHNYEATKECYERIYVKDPLSHEAAFNIGNSYFFDHNYKLALEYYEKSTRICHNFHAFCNMASSFLETGDLKRAEEYYSKAKSFLESYIKSHELSLRKLDSKIREKRQKDHTLE
jgi:tetratricopeptide (TPR) repeat protein